MFERAILRVWRPALPRRRAGGMDVLERQLFVAARAGVKSLWIVGRELVEARGGVVKTIPLVPGLSTTGLLQRIRSTAT
ncbi:MAG: hypothetical protein AABZ24_04205 [Nitrospirota bacterium]